MSTPEKPDIPGWFGLRQPWLLTIARPLGPLLSVVVILLFALAVTAAGAILLHAIFDLGLGTPRTGFGTGAVIVALLGAPFVIWRAVVAQKTVSVQEQGQITDRINKAVQGLGAEKEVNRLGRNRTYINGLVRETAFEWKDQGFELPEGAAIPKDLEKQPVEKWENITLTEPNLEVRLGAIYALERIAQDSDRDHVQIMEILCAYIRHNAPAPKADDWPEQEMREREDEVPPGADWKYRYRSFLVKQKTAKGMLEPREDIQVALTVIGRRDDRQRRLEAGRGEEENFPFDDRCPDFDGSKDDVGTVGSKLAEWKRSLFQYKGYRLDLRNTDLRGADLSNLNFNGARLNGAHLHFASLQGARMKGAVLMEAFLPIANLAGAWLQGALFQGAKLDEAYLSGACLHCASLGETRLQMADLGGAKLQQAKLGRANLNGAWLDQHTDLAAADLNGTAVALVDFSEVTPMKEHLKDMFGDASLTLPGGHGPEHEDWPTHWPRHALGPEEFDEEWRKWLADREGYTPPDPPRAAG